MSDPLINIAKALAVDKSLRKLELQTVLETLMACGVLAKNDAIGIALEIAEKARCEPVDADMTRYRDQQALHYEDVAAQLSGQASLPR